tara:strand:- start:16 stop:675 length:660 start_codon:yes stop_codon:yes gene_type:complete
MKSLEFKAGKLVEKCQVPEGWNDVPFTTYIKYLELIEFTEGDADPLEIFKLFFGISDDMAKSNFRIEMLVSMNEQLNFISTAPETKEFPTHFKMGKEYHLIPKDISELTLGRYRDIVETGAHILQGFEESPTAMIKTFPEMIAIFCAPEKYTQTYLDEMVKTIEQFSTPEIVVIGNFFIRQYVILRSGTKQSWFHRLAATLRRMIQQNFPKFQRISVIY